MTRRRDKRKSAGRDVRKRRKRRKEDRAAGPKLTYAQLAELAASVYTAPAPLIFDVRDVIAQGSSRATYPILTQEQLREMAEKHLAVPAARRYDRDK